MKDTLVIMCSGTGFTPKVLNFLHKKFGLGEIDYDLLAVPGSIHSLALTAFLPKFRWTIRRWLKFLLEEHGLKRIIVIDHDGCGWFKKITLSEPVVIGKVQSLALHLAIDELTSLLPEKTILEIWRVSPAKDEVKFEKIK